MFLKNVSQSTLSFSFKGQSVVLAPNDVETFDDRDILELKKVAKAFEDKVQFEMEDSTIIEEVANEAVAQALQDANLTTPSTRLLFVDRQRVEEYEEMGTVQYPFKTIQAAIDYASEQGNGDTVPYSVVIANGTYPEQLNMNDKFLFSLTLVAQGRVAIVPASGNAFTSTENNTMLQDLICRDIEFGRPLEITGSSTPNQFKTVEFRSCSFNATATLNFTTMNNVAFWNVYCEAAINFTNVNYMYLGTGQIQGLFTAVMDSNLPAPAQGVVGGYNIQSLIANNVVLTAGGSGVLNFVLHGCRVGTTVGNYTIGAGVILSCFNSLLRGNWTNNNQLILRNSHTENNVLGTAPTISANRSNQAAYTAGTPADWNTAPTNVEQAINRLASAVAGLLSNPIP